MAASLSYLKVIFPLLQVSLGRGGKDPDTFLDVARQLEAERTIGLCVRSQALCRRKGEKRKANEYITIVCVCARTAGPVTRARLKRNGWGAQQADGPVCRQGKIATALLGIGSHVVVNVPACNDHPAEFPCRAKRNEKRGKKREKTEIALSG